MVCTHTRSRVRTKNKLVLKQLLFDDTFALCSVLAYVQPCSTRASISAGLVRERIRVACGKNCMSLGHAFSDKQSSIAFRRRTSSPMASRNHGGVASPQGFVVVSRDTVRGDVQHIRMPANSAASAPCLNGREKIHRCALRISLTCWCVRRQSCATSPWCVRRQSCANSP